MAMADAGIGVAIAPQSCATFIPKENLIFKEIADQQLNLSSVVVWPKSRALSTAAKNFLGTFLDD